MDNKGLKTKNDQFDFESIEQVRNRVYEELKPYLHLDKIIVVCHGIVITAFTTFGDFVDYCGIREVELK